MCGLAGYARHPEGQKTDGAKRVVEALLMRSVTRGRHATGFAAINTVTNDSFIWKKAIPADIAVKSDPWKAAMGRVTAEYTVLLGHTRHATQNNAQKDDCAHPFQCGEVIGAHNGMITNWLDLAKKFPKDGADWQVDSEAAFCLLSRFNDPNKALDKLDGYWALTWTLGQHLYLCRTADAQLTCAYIGRYRTLMWASERSVLTQTLVAAGIDLTADDVEVWEPQANTIYRYDPAAFTEQGTGAVKADATFRSRSRGRNDTSRTGAGCATTPSSGKYSQTDVFNRSDWVREGGTWRPRRTVDTTEADTTPARFAIDGPTISKILARLDELENLVLDLSGKQEGADAEIAHIYDVLNEAGIMQAGLAEDYPHGGLNEDEADALLAELAAEEDQAVEGERAPW